MCFSATASFTTAAILIPAGLVCLRKTIPLNNSSWGFSLYLLAFGTQQAFEGGVWWSLESGNSEALRLFATGFLFFSHFFWLAWVPYSCYLTELIPQRKRIFLLFSRVGTAFGVSMFSAFLLYPDWLSVSIINQSIAYHTILIYDDYLPRFVITLVYMFIVITPLIWSSNPHHKILGGLILLSATVTILFFKLTFISVWCYFAALISLYIYQVAINPKPVDSVTARI